MVICVASEYILALLTNIPLRTAIDKARSVNNGRPVHEYVPPGIQGCPAMNEQHSEPYLSASTALVT